MELVDSHCHIHWKDYGLSADEVLAEAGVAGVNRLICVGTTLAESQLAVEFATKHNNCWASVGVHPHDSREYVGEPSKLKKLAELAKSPRVVAIGETGLDYHYNHSPPPIQQEMFRWHLDLAKELKLPMIFHVREAHEDFWRILTDYPNVQGVLHSFTAGPAELAEALKRGLYIGLNGIVTFAKDDNLQHVAKTVPLSKLLLETDAPFLTPAPYRGTVCQPKHVLVVAKYLSELRGEDPAKLASATTKNALKLFNLK